MAIEAPLSSYKKKNILIIAAALIGMGLWFAYDGYINSTYIDKHTVDGKADDDLVMNKRLAPTLTTAGLLAIGYFFFIKSKKIVADENELVCEKIKISYDTIEKVNKTHFDSKGFFVVTYSQDGQSKELKLSDRTYDNLGAVLDQIVSKII